MLLLFASRSYSWSMPFCECEYRRGPGWSRDRHSTFPAGYGATVEGDCVWRLQVTHWGMVYLFAEVVHVFILEYSQLATFVLQLLAAMLTILYSRAPTYLFLLSSYFICWPCVLIPGYQVPQLVDQYLAGTLPIEHYITHEFTGVESIDTAMHMLHEGSCLRAVVKY